MSAGAASAELPVAASWFEARPVGDGVTLITEPHVAAWFRCNIWHVRGRDRDLLVDSGMGIGRLAPVVAALGSRPVIAVATHTHCDHVGSHWEFAHCAVHAAEAAVLADPADALTLAHEFREWPGAVSALPGPEWRLDGYRVRPAAGAEILTEGGRIDLGDRAFTVLHLPGHSPGSIGLLDEAAGLLFSGDAVYDGELLDALPGSDVPAYLDTMERLRRLPVRLVHGGHRASFGRERLLALIDEYLAGRRRPGCPVAGN